MSYCYFYYFQFDGTLDELAERFNQLFGSDLKPSEDRSMYSGRVFATNYFLEHNWVDEKQEELNDFS